MLLPFLHLCRVPKEYSCHCPVLTQDLLKTSSTYCQSTSGRLHQNMEFHGSRVCLCSKHSTQHFKEIFWVGNTNKDPYVQKCIRVCIVNHSSSSPLWHDNIETNEKASRMITWKERKDISLSLNSPSSFRTVNLLFLWS